MSNTLPPSIAFFSAFVKPIPSRAEKRTSMASKLLESPTFAIVSAWIGECSLTENKARHEALIGLAHVQGVRFQVVQGIWEGQLETSIVCYGLKAVTFALQMQTTFQQQAILAKPFGKEVKLMFVGGREQIVQVSQRKTTDNGYTRFEDGSEVVFT